MKNLNIISLVFLLCVLGCEEKANEYPREVKRYTVLIGEKSYPHYDDVNIGDLFGNGDSMMTYGNDDFGAVRVYWDGKIDGEFSRGGIILTRDSGCLAIDGYVDRGLFVYVLIYEGSDQWMLVEKKKIPIGMIHDFMISLPPEE